MSTGSAMDAVVARAREELGSLEDSLHRLSSARALVAHPSGLARVEVDELGGLCGLWLPESLAGVDADDLARAVVETAARAAELVAERRETILASLARALTD